MNSLAWIIFQDEGHFLLTRLKWINFPAPFIVGFKLEARIAVRLVFGQLVSAFLTFGRSWGVNARQESFGCCAIYGLVAALA